MENILMLMRESNNDKPLRVTSQRKAIIRVLYNSQHKHLTAADIHHALWKQGEKLGRSTVYRNLVTLEKLGIVNKLSLENRSSSYELVSDSNCFHYNFVCLNCGEKIVIKDPIYYRNIYLSAQYCNFQIAQIDLTIKGYCKSCQGNIEKGRRIEKD